MSILTLQFGHYANFVGAHWWNTQENSFKYDSPSEIDNDILFREGLNQKGEVTFTPRALLVDLKGSLKTLSEDGELYKSQSEINNEDYEVIAEKLEEKNEFQKDLDQFNKVRKIYDFSAVKVWSDFLYTRFHPRTVNVIREFTHNDEKNQFNVFPQGATLWKTEQFSEDFADKIRNYVEECDKFQGFQVIADSTNGFSGLSSSCLEYLRDEYDSKTVISFPVNITPSNLIETINLGFCYEGLIEHSNIFTPIETQNSKFKYIDFDANVPYQTSAILASVLDTLSLNYRLKHNNYHLIDLCADFVKSGRKAVASSTTFPFLLKGDLIDCLDTWQGPLTQSVSPCKIDSDNSLQLLTLRGIPESRLKTQNSPRQSSMPAFRCDTIREMLSYYLACTCFHSRNLVTVCGEPLPVKTPFPGFFTGDVGTSVSVMAGLHSGKFVGEIFEDLGGRLEGVKFKKLHQFAAEGVEGDQFGECLERILSFRDCYEDDYLL